MKKVTTPWGVAVLLLLVSLWVAVIPGITAQRSMELIRLFGPVILPAAIVTALLFAYFEWRTKLVNRIRDQHHGHGRTL